MSNKLNHSKEHLKEFSIDKVIDFEGCPTALKYLKQKFGDRVENLNDCRKEVEELILKDGKAEWIINFILNLLTPKNRAKFFFGELSCCLALLADQEATNEVLEAVEYYSKYSNQKTLLKFINKLEKYLIPVKAELEHYKNCTDKKTIDEKVINFLNQERLILEATLCFLNDKDKNFTRSVTKGLLKLAESKSNFNIVEYNYDKTIQSIAMDLMEFTELWPKK